jgi:hypothetical protein
MPALTNTWHCLPSSTLKHTSYRWLCPNPVTPLKAKQQWWHTQRQQFGYYMCDKVAMGSSMCEKVIEACRACGSMCDKCTEVPVHSLTWAPCMMGLHFHPWSQFTLNFQAFTSFLCLRHMWPLYTAPSLPLRPHQSWPMPNMFLHRSRKSGWAWSFLHMSGVH